jgi:SanA protein
MIKFLIKSALLVFISALFFAIFANVLIISKTHDKVYHSIHDAPNKEVALVLGTSKRTVSGESNSFFQHRMEAAAALYKYDKVNKLLLSGDNRTRYYNEPADMKKALIALGVPDSVIMIDSAGYRTYESISRCADVFKQKDIMIITQEFHAYRALYISSFFDLNAIAFCAEEVPIYSSSKVNIREFFARPKALIDVYLPSY